MILRANTRNFWTGVARRWWSRGLSLLAILAVLGNFFSTAPAHAQNSGQLSLTTSPLPISLKAKPGEAITTDLRIRNSGPHTEKLKVGLMKFSAHGEEGKPELKDREVGDDYFDWVRFSETEFTAEPNEWKTIKMTISLPRTAAFGYYYAVTFTRANPGKSAGRLQSAVRGGSAILILLEANVPNAKRELSLRSFSVSKRTYEFLPAKFSIKLHNSGNVHSAPTGTIFINKGDEQIAALSVNSNSGNILPNSNRIYTAEWSDGFPVYKIREEKGQTISKDGQSAYQLKWNLGELHKLRFGKYTAMLIMAYDDGIRDVPLEGNLSFWVVPWRIIISILLILMFTGIGIWVTVRKGLFRAHRMHKISRR